jgi:hypothetical protein
VRRRCAVAHTVPFIALMKPCTGSWHGQGEGGRAPEEGQVNVVLNAILTCAVSFASRRVHCVSYGCMPLHRTSQQCTCHASFDLPSAVEAPWRHNGYRFQDVGEYCSLVTAPQTDTHTQKLNFL